MSGEKTYMCNRCWNLWLVVPDSPSPLGAVKCQGCGSTSTEEMPTWAPFGSDLSEGSAAWECACQQRRHVFRLPVPRSPAEEKEISCPDCGSRHIHHLTPTGIEPLYCG